MLTLISKQRAVYPVVRGTEVCNCCSKTCAATVQMAGQQMGTHSEIDVQTGVTCLRHFMPVFAAFFPCYYVRLKESICMSFCGRVKR